MSTPVYNQQPTLQNRPLGKKDAQGNLNSDSFLDEAFQGDYSGGENLIYKGFARPGSLTSAPVWQIAMCSYDGNDNILTVMWPKLTSSSPASNDYMFIWDNRSSYTYS